MHPVVRECLENAQAVRFRLYEDRDALADVPAAVVERMVLHERMLTYLLGALDYLARGDGDHTVLFDTLEERPVEGIGADLLEPFKGNDGDVLHVS